MVVVRVVGYSWGQDLYRVRGAHDSPGTGAEHNVDPGMRPGE